MIDWIDDAAQEIRESYEEIQAKAEVARRLDVSGYYDADYNYVMEEEIGKIIYKYFRQRMMKLLEED